VTAGRELPEAIADCTEAIRLRPKYDVALENRGHAYLRTGQFDLALADFEARLALSKSAYSLYGRGVAKLKKGDAAGSADVAAAKALQSDIAAFYSSRGVPAP
jgi:tetratricopeptide (TPR) repeat protein